MHRIITFVLVCACASLLNGRALAQSSEDVADRPEEGPGTDAGEAKPDSDTDPTAGEGEQTEPLEGQTDPDAPEGDTASELEADTDTAPDEQPEQAASKDSPAAVVPDERPTSAPGAQAEKEWQTEEVQAPAGVWEEPAEEEGADPEELFQKRFEKGMQEVSVGLATAGYSDYFFLGVSGAYRRYVIDNLALGAEVSYTHIFSDEDNPEELTIMPQVQYVFLLSKSVAPYLAVLGGREFEWSSWREADSWFLGGGVGAHIRIGERVSLNVRVLFTHHWYDRTKVYGVDDDFVVKDQFGRRMYECESEQGCEWSDAEEAVLWGSRFEEEPQPCTGGEDGLTEAELAVCQNYPSRVCNSSDPSAECAEYVDDPGDKKREWIYPVINFGVSIAF